jgi:hypothetical protein
MSTDHLTKLTVKLVSRSTDAMEVASVLTGDSRTDTVNRALQVYAYLLEQIILGNRLLQLVDPDGTVHAAEFE